MCEVDMKVKFVRTSPNETMILVYGPPHPRKYIPLARPSLKHFSLESAVAGYDEVFAQTKVLKTSPDVQGMAHQSAALI